MKMSDEPDPRPRGRWSSTRFSEQAARGIGRRFGPPALAAREQRHHHKVRRAARVSEPVVASWARFRLASSRDSRAWKWLRKRCRGAGSRADTRVPKPHDGGTLVQQGLTFAYGSEMARPAVAGHAPARPLHDPAGRGDWSHATCASLPGPYGEGHRAVSCGRSATSTSAAGKSCVGRGARRRRSRRRRCGSMAGRRSR